jgi:hypothetical protein
MTIPRAPTVAHPLAPLLAVVTLLGAGSCSGVSSRPIEGDGGSPASADEILAFQEDGVARTAFAAAVATLVVGSRGQLFNLQAAQRDEKAALTITIARNPGPITAGSYSCGPTAAILHSSFSPAVTHSGAVAGGSCTITLTAVGARDRERVTGTFSGVLVSSSGSTKTIAAGQFSLPLTIVMAP